MYPSKKFLPGRLARTFRLPRLSPKSSPISDQKPDSFFLNHADNVLPCIAETQEDASEPISCFDDFEEITFDDIQDFPIDQETRSLPPLGRLTSDISLPYPLATSASKHSSRPGRSKSVSHSLPQVPLSRSFSRSSLQTLPRRETRRPPPHPPASSEREQKDLLLDFPKPPAHILAFASSPQSPIEDSSSAFYDSDPFRRESYHSESSAASSDANPLPLINPNTLPPSPPSTRPPSPSTIAPSESRSTSVKLFASLRYSLRVPRRPKFPRLVRRASDPSGDWNPKNPPQAVDFQPLPEFVPEPFDLSFSLKENQKLRNPSITVEEGPEHFNIPTVVVSEDPPSTNHLTVPLITYQCVNPLELTRSPSVCTAPELYSLSATPAPPSPAWLSRNIQGIENRQGDAISIAYAQTPPSPAPLFVPPPVPVGYVRPPEIIVTQDSTSSDLQYHSSRRSRRSTPRRRSLSYSSSIRRRSPIWKSRSPTILVRSPSSLQRSNSFSVDTSPYSRDPLFFVESFPKTSSVPDLLATPADHPSLLPPINLFTSHPKPASSSVFNPPNLPTPHDFFIPSRNPAEPEDHLKLPQHILHQVIFALLYEASFFSYEFTKMSFNVFGKSAETVDFGEEVDYPTYEWFKDPPPPRHAPNTPAAETFVPQPGVIDQNEMFAFALKSAPNVLYARYKQYGQLGVLAWCSEFSEMIDALKTLGFDGNMFVATRTQALKACEEILRLHIEVKMQIIVMYLSSQVVRLRRFLDGERQWDDYPLITFPLPPSGPFS